MKVRAWNCTVALANLDRNGENIIGQQGDNSAQVCLAELYAPAGGERRTIGSAFPGLGAVVLGGQSLELAVALQDDDASLETAAGAEYGLLIGCWLFRTAFGGAK
jgi:hypothetical protein